MHGEPLALLMRLELVCPMAACCVVVWVVSRLPAAVRSVPLVPVTCPPAGSWGLYAGTVLPEDETGVVMVCS